MLGLEFAAAAARFEMALGGLEGQAPLDGHQVHKSRLLGHLSVCIILRPAEVKRVLALEVDLEPEILPHVVLPGDVCAERYSRLFEFISRYRADEAPVIDVRLDALILLSHRAECVNDQT